MSKQLVRRPIAAGSFYKINQCFLFLGAQYDEVYHPQTGCHAYKRYGRRINGGRLHNRTIYERYTVDVLYAWAHELYINCMWQYHPDRHPQDQKHCTELCSAFGEAYGKIVRSLKRKGLKV